MGDVLAAQNSVGSVAIYSTRLSPLPWARCAPGAPASLALGRDQRVCLNGTGEPLACVIARSSLSSGTGARPEFTSRLACREAERAEILESDRVSPAKSPL